MLSQRAAWTEEEIELLKRNYRRMKYADLALALGKTEGAVRNFIYRNGLRKRAEYWSDADLNILRVHYAAERPNLEEMERLLGRDGTNISRKARELGLTKYGRRKTEQERLSMSKRATEQIRRNGHPRGMLGKKHSPAAREAMSEKLKARWADSTSSLHSESAKQMRSDRMAALQQSGRARNQYSRGSMGKRDDLGGLYVRSAWEANYARYLNWLIEQGQIQKWEYEADIFVFEAIKRGTRSYTPDFKVWNKDGTIEYHEVKGWMDQKSKTKLKRMAKYYPAIQIVLIDAAIYRDIAKKVGALIAGWEGR